MANSYEPYHVPQQSRRDKLRFSSSAIFPLVDVDFLSASTEPHSPGNFMGFLGGVSVTGSLSSSSAVAHGGGDKACNQTFNGVGLGGDVFVFKPEPLSLSLSSHHNYYTLHRSGYDIGVPGAGGSVASRGSVPLGPLGPFTGYASILKGSKFLKPAQQLLEEFCNVGRGIYSDIIDDGDDSSPSLESTVENITSSSGGGESSKKKSMLISMLDEVYKKYKQYNDQIQGVIESFECVAGLGNVTPFVNMALKALSKHFKCLKNTIIDQLHFTNKTQQQGQPQGYFDHHPPVWKPHRGLPECAVIVLRAWLFDHFLHPYPTDTDKLMLAKKTGLSRNQVSNWFINARVRLWKPMVEEIHLLETRKLHKSALRSTTVISDNVLPENPHYSLLSKRTQNDVVPCAGGSSGDDVLGFSYGGQNVPVLSTNGVSLTLGLHHQNNGIGLTEPFPVTASQRFELGGGEGYAGGGGGLEGQNRQFGRNFSGGSSSNQLLNEFIG